MSWMNSDGLYVKFGTEEGAAALGGEVSTTERHMIEFVINYTEVLSATAAIIDGGSGTGARGVIIPKGARLEGMEVVVETAFTSSGTIGSSTLVMGTKKASDRSTELDHDGLTTTSFVAGVLDAVGERTYVTVGVTGAGDDWGTTLAEDGVLVAANSAHASHPYTAGKARIRLYYRNI